MADGSGAKYTVLGAPKFVEPQRVLGSIGVRAVALVGLIWFDQSATSSQVIVTWISAVDQATCVPVRGVSSRSEKSPRSLPPGPRSLPSGPRNLSGVPRPSFTRVDLLISETAAEKHRFEMRW
ncbi:hypothetical protein MJO29_005551 [Puccinia striiformis f. sp. tritici]|nr:hypothetical protein MJO29_005551 [Puccinia striiformis f. sp. tritici]KAI9621002.1 hypothetical protein KEM48_007935 [Puccinia striiformis f. sp. tritici PST-130]